MKYFCQNLAEHKNNQPVEVKKNEDCPGCGKKMDWNNPHLALFLSNPGYATAPVTPMTFSFDKG